MVSAREPVPCDAGEAKAKPEETVAGLGAQTGAKALYIFTTVQYCSFM